MFKSNKHPKNHDKTYHLLTRTKTHAIPNPTFHTLFTAFIQLDIVEPKSLKTALFMPRWLAAMHDELNALKLNETWSLGRGNPI